MLFMTNLTCTLSILSESFKIKVFKVFKVFSGVQLISDVLKFASLYHFVHLCQCVVYHICIIDIVPVLSRRSLIAVPFLVPVRNLFREFWITCNVLQSSNVIPASLCIFHVILQGPYVSKHGQTIH